jgi:hypothetical protein
MDCVFYVFISVVFFFYWLICGYEQVCRVPCLCLVYVWVFWIPTCIVCIYVLDFLTLRADVVLIMDAGLHTSSTQCQPHSLQARQHTLSVLFETLHVHHAQLCDFMLEPTHMYAEAAKHMHELFTCLVGVHFCLTSRFLCVPSLTDPILV